MAGVPHIINVPFFSSCNYDVPRSPLVMLILVHFAVVVVVANVIADLAAAAAVVVDMGWSLKSCSAKVKKKCNEK